MTSESVAIGLELSTERLTSGHYGRQGLSLYWVLSVTSGSAGMRGVPQDPPHHADCRQGQSGAGSVQVIAENKEKGECFILLHIPEAQQRDRQWMINKCARASNQLIPLKIALSSISPVTPPFPTPDVPFWALFDLAIQ